MKGHEGVNCAQLLSPELLVYLLYSSRLDLAHEEQVALGTNDLTGM